MNNGNSCRNMTAMRFRFDNFELDVDGGTLLGPRGNLSLPDKPFRLLCALVKAQGSIVSKDAAMADVWPGQIISDAAFATALKTVRKSLGDGGKTQRLIETVKGRGIRMAVPVTQPSVIVPQADDDSNPAGKLSNPPVVAILRFSFADGSRSDPLQQAIPADLISAMSNTRELRIISRGTALQFLSSSTSPRVVQEQCGAKYVLSGDIQGLKHTRHITLELCDARSEHIVWSKEFDFTGAADDDLSLSLQQQIRAVVLREIAYNESVQARRKPTELLDAWEAYHLGVTAKLQNTAQGNAQALSYLRRAITIDPDFSSAYAAMAFAAFGTAFNHYGTNRAEFLENSISWANKAIQIDPDNPHACLAKGRSYWAKKAPEEGLCWLDRALEIAPIFPWRPIVEAY